MSQIQRLAVMMGMSAFVVGCSAAMAIVGYRTFRRAATAMTAQRVPAYGEVPIVYFYGRHCEACAASLPTIDRLERKYPGKVSRVDSEALAGYRLLKQYYAAYTVPNAERWRVPIVFAGQAFFMGSDRVMQDLPAYVREAAAGGRLQLPPRPGEAEVAGVTVSGGVQ